MSDEKWLCFPPTVLSGILLLLQYFVHVDFFLVCSSCWGAQLHKPLSLILTLWSYPGPSLSKGQVLDLIM